MAHAVLWALMNLSTLVPGLLARAFFDTLTGAATIPAGTTGIVVLLAALALGQAALWLIAGYVEIVFRFLASALLRRNLLARLLERPGALALPYGIGETISRFRDDVDVAEDSLDWTDEIIGYGVIALVAVAILFTINGLLTLAVFAPLVAVVFVAQRFSAALGRYRAASSQAASEVAGALGDMLTAVETRARRRGRRAGHRPPAPAQPAAAGPDGQGPAGDPGAGGVHRQPARVRHRV